MASALDVAGLPMNMDKGASEEQQHDEKKTKQPGADTERVYSHDSIHATSVIEDHGRRFSSTVPQLHRFRPLPKFTYPVLAKSP